jgi:hypothetical protein
MADIKIGALPAATALTGAEIFEVVQGGASKKATGDQISALTGSTANATLNTRLNALAPRQGVAGLGATSLTGIILDQDTARLLGFARTISLWFRSSALGTIESIICSSDYVSSGWELRFSTGNSLFFALNSSSTTRYAVSFGSAGQYRDGNWHHIGLSLDYTSNDGTVAPVVVAVLDGVVVTPTVATAFNGTYADVTSTGLRIGGRGSNGTPLAATSSIGNVSILNFAAPATTTSGVVGVAERYASGVWVQAGEQWGVLDLLGTGAWVTQAGFTNFSSADKTSWSADAVGVASRIQHTVTPFSVKIGQRVTVRCTRNSGSSGLTVTLREGEGTTISNVATVLAGENEYNLVATSNSVDCRITYIGASALSQVGLEVNGISTKLNGSTLDLTPIGVGRVLIDRSASRNHAIVSGTVHPTYLQPAESGRIIATTNQTPNQQLLALSAFDAANKYRITSWTVTSTGTPTISLGNASAGTQYVNGLTLVANTPTAVTLATSIAATANLWCNSSIQPTP